SEYSSISGAYPQVLPAPATAAMTPAQCVPWRSGPSAHVPPTQLFPPATLRLGCGPIPLSMTATFTRFPRLLPRDAASQLTCPQSKPFTGTDRTSTLKDPTGMLSRTFDH